MSPFLKMFLVVLLLPIAGLIALGIAGALGAGIVAGVKKLLGKGPSPAETACRETEKQTRCQMEEKYRNFPALEKYSGSLDVKLRDLGKDVLHAGDPEKALEYLSDARALNDSLGTQLVLVECYGVLGQPEKSKAILDGLIGVNHATPDACFFAVLQRLSEEPVELLERGYNRFLKVGSFYGSREEGYRLYRAAREQLLQDLAAAVPARLREAQKLADKGDSAAAAEFCKARYAEITKVAHKEELAKCGGALTELAWQVAVYCCSTKQYHVAKEYLDKENCSAYPTYYYIRMLAETSGGKGGFGNPDLLRKALDEDVERAIREGIPGAEQVKAHLEKTYLRALDIAIDNARFELEQMRAEEAFEEAHGMSREEYAERQKEKAAEAARAVRADRLREKIDLAERDVDLLSGGSGYSMEEKLARGDISYADHELYREAKEKYIKKKSE